MNYKESIKTELSKYHWELIEIGNIDEWWEEEHWKIQWKHSQGLVVYIQFLIDAMYLSRVWEIQATFNLYNKDEYITCLNMSKRKFDTKLKAFIEELEAFRKNN